MKNVLQSVPGIVMLGLVGMTIGSCSKNNSNNDGLTNQKQIKIESNATLGKIIVDKDGRSLYFFSNDADGANTCTGGCEALWSPFFILPRSQHRPTKDNSPIKAGRSTITLPAERLKRQVRQVGRQSMEFGSWQNQIIQLCLLINN